MKRLYLSLVLISFCLPFFSQVYTKEELQNAPSKEYAVPEFDLHSAQKNWDTYPVNSNGAFRFEMDSASGILKISHSDASPSNWYIKMKDRKKAFKYEPDSIICVSFSARRTSGSGFLQLALSGLKGDQKNKDNWASSLAITKENFESFTFYFEPDGQCDYYYFRFIGKENGTFEIKDLKARYISGSLYKAPALTINESVFKNGHFEGPLSSRPTEKPGRGLTAIHSGENTNLISWRTLKSDTKKTCFSVYKVKNQKEKLLTSKPLTASTYEDTNGRAGDIYLVKGWKDSSMQELLFENTVECSPFSYRTLKLQNPAAAAARGGIAAGDLDGDGEYDYVIKTSADKNIDPSDTSGWRPSTDPFTLEAYKNDGSLLWTKNLGWNIESGIWYSPYVVCDLDGDGRAEVIAKTGEFTDKGGKDYRGTDGRVTSGPQYLSVFDGLTGTEIARTDWITWEAFNSEKYSNSVRNQIAIAYLDGKTPCILMLSGTYGHQEVKAFFLDNGNLVNIWNYNNEGLGSAFQGQGAHWTVCTDIDQDGRDEVIIGSVCLDDNGQILWNTGRGHPDAVYYGDISPAHPGKELLFIYETKQKDGGFLLLDLKGKELWKFDQPTTHVHSQVLCIDLNPKTPGREFYGMNSAPGHIKTRDCWYFDGNGTLLKSGNQIPEDWGFSPRAAYLTDSPYPSLFQTKAFKTENKFRISGTVVHIFDLDGDWRDEILTTLNGEIRIYSTIEKTGRRHFSSMQDTFYRSVVTNNSSGYSQYPVLPDGLNF